MNPRRASSEGRPPRGRRRSAYRDERPHHDEYIEEPIGASYNDRPGNPMNEAQVGIYGALYRLIFAFVYALLDMILSPLTRGSKTSRRDCERGHTERSGGYGSYHDRLQNDYTHMEEGYCRPQHAEPNAPSNQRQRPREDRYYRTQQAHPTVPVSQRQRLQDARTPLKKTVQFSQNKAYRPPLGRIDLATKNSDASVSSSSTSSTSSSSSSGSFIGGLGYSTSPRRAHRSLDRILAVSTPRTSHSSYFVGQY